MESGKHFRKRTAILDALRSTREHPSAETLLAMLKDDYPDLSLATVYRNLNLFREKGLIVSLGSFGGVERFDGNTGAHVHFVCDRCQRVQDLMEIEVPASLPQQVMDACGGLVESYRLSFSGLCADCKSIKEGESA